MTSIIIIFLCMGARLVTLTPDFEGAHCWIYQRGARLAYNVGEGSPTIYHSIHPLLCHVML